MPMCKLGIAALVMMMTNYRNIKQMVNKIRKVMIITVMLVNRTVKMKAAATIKITNMKRYMW